MEALRKIQSELKAPKNQRNNFGKYNYRSCEDILEAVKPLLKKYNCTLTISDRTIEIGGYLVIDSTVSISDDKLLVVSNAQAGVDPNRKGMDIAQSFGSSSSYARKYALNGLFLIDDTKDADATNDHKPTEPVKKAKPVLKAKSKEYKDVFSGLQNGFTMEQVKGKYEVSKSVETQLLKELGNENA